MRAAAVDISPLRESPPFRRMFFGQTVSIVGSQVTQVAVALQVYAITGSSLYVGLIGVVGLVPLIVFGLYGGAIADAVDRRRLILVTSLGMMAVSVVLLVQAAMHARSVALLFACVAVQSAFTAIDSPTRRAVIPQLISAEKLPAANTISMGGFQFGIIAGPMIAGVAVGTGGFSWAYAVDAASFVGALYGAVRLPRLPAAVDAAPAGLKSVVEGLRFIGRSKVVMMTFLVDVIAMVFGMPRALFPALATHLYHGGAGTAGLLYAAPAVGALIATMLGGAIARVHRQGLGIVIAIAGWGAAIAIFGLVSSLWIGLVMLAVAGASDTVSAVYRSTMLQVATPPTMQGRLQGVFIVVVNGGPRLGDLEAGVAASVSPQFAVVSGGLACIVGMAICAVAVPAFLLYDHREAVQAMRAMTAAQDAL